MPLQDLKIIVDSEITLELPNPSSVNEGVATQFFSEKATQML